MQAICVLHQTKYKGHILFTEKSFKHTEIHVKLEGLPPGKKRGFHIHENGKSHGWLSKSVHTITQKIKKIMET